MFEALGLDSATLVVFALCFLAVCLFEFVNGFHDTANAVATVIYTNSLKPTVAVIWSGLWNFAGVLLGVGVAMSIMKLIPLYDMMQQPLSENVAIVTAIMITAIGWNLGTWYFGIHCSSSHTLIGSLLGAGLVFWLRHGGDGVNWEKAGEIGISLVVSPMFGFAMSFGVLWLLRSVLNKQNFIFHAHKPGQTPPLWIRAILIVCSTLVSFVHGMNDGQKGIALMMVVLISFSPTKFALSDSFDTVKSRQEMAIVRDALPASEDVLKFKADKIMSNIDSIAANPKSTIAVMNVRKGIIGFAKEAGLKIKGSEAKSALKAVKGYAENPPSFIPFIIALCLGLGTMIGWKRIVVTIGEKIGKDSMTYAEGAASGVIAAMTIGLSTGFGLPVSTTHVVSSGVAGAMASNKGVKNLQGNTLKNIMLSWVLTLPVTIGGAAFLYWFFVTVFA